MALTGVGAAANTPTGKFQTVHGFLLSLSISPFCAHVNESHGCAQFPRGEVRKSGISCALCSESRRDAGSDRLNMQCDRLLTLSPTPGIAIFSNHFEPGPTKNRAIAALGAGQAIGYIVGLIGGQSPSLSARSHFRPPSHIAAPGALP